MKRSYLLMAFLVFVISCGSESQTRIKVSVDATPQNVSFPEGTVVDHIDIEVSKSGAIVPASINGQPPLPFLFDSGSTVNAISVELAEKLGLRRLDTKAKSLIGQVESEDLLYYAESVQIGNTVFHQISFRAKERDRMIKDKSEQLLGILLFEKNPFTLDLARSKLSIYNAPPHHTTAWSPLDLSELRVPKVPVTFRDPATGKHLCQFMCVVDTGAKGGDYPTLIMPRAIPASDPRIQPYLIGEGKPMEMTTSLTASQFTYYLANVRIDFGQVEADGQFILFFENDGEGSFAFKDMGFLELSMFLKASMTFDIANERWAVSYAEEEVRFENTSNRDFKRP